MRINVDQDNGVEKGNLVTGSTVRGRIGVLIEATDVTAATGQLTQ